MWEAQGGRVWGGKAFRAHVPRQGTSRQDGGMGPSARVRCPAPRPVRGAENPRPWKTSDPGGTVRFVRAPRLPGHQLGLESNTLANCNFKSQLNTEDRIASRLCFAQK